MARVPILSPDKAGDLDKELMSTGGFSIDQLMELAGLAVAQTVFRVHPPSSGRRVLILAGPGNNGGDGLVAGRHLKWWGYSPVVYCPKPSKNEIYGRLLTQLKSLQVEFVDNTEEVFERTDHIVDAIFGFSFSGPLRDPFPKVISLLERTRVPVTSVDAPSSWDIEKGPPEEGPGSKFQPNFLISLTAPKPCVKHFKGRHFLGGRGFLLGGDLERKYGLDGITELFEGDSQIAELK